MFKDSETHGTNIREGELFNYDDNVTQVGKCIIQSTGILGSISI